jgi:hypothetical protein
MEYEERIVNDVAHIDGTKAPKVRNYTVQQDAEI